MDDLDAFLNDIEQFVVEGTEQEKENRCTQCNEILEQTDDSFVCPKCGFEASNMLVTEESEIYMDTADGQSFQLHRLDSRVKKQHSIDYGWAWSTDEAIVDILTKQVLKLEEYKLVPRVFRKAVKNLWLKFWAMFVAPYIRDSYREDDLIPFTTLDSLKYRDIDVLIKVHDRVMIPEQIKHDKNTHYSMNGYKFYSKNPQNTLQFSHASSNSSSVLPDRFLEVTMAVDGEIQGHSIDDVKQGIAVDAEFQGHSVERPEFAHFGQVAMDQSLPNVSGMISRHNPTNVLSFDSISFLTLNRTLAFIEATARVLSINLYASDIIRLVNQRFIPFYGAHRSLPEHVRLNYKDRLMFQKIRSPSPLQLTRAASLLLNRVYNEKRPFTISVPAFDKALVRILVDLNLPLGILDKIDRFKNFSTQRQTKPVIFSDRTTYCKHLPQYDRWTFAILVCYIMKFFPMLDSELNHVSEMIGSRSKADKENYFDPKQWFHQLSARLDLVTRYDPYILMHPMVDTQKMETNPQLFTYLARILQDIPSATTRKIPTSLRDDLDLRETLVDFVSNNIPHPKGKYYRKLKVDKSLKEPRDFHHPIIDSLKRTQEYWKTEISEQPQLWDLLQQDFKSDATILMPTSSWSLYQNKSAGNSKLEIDESYPESFKLLLAVGGFICYCQPKELLREIRCIKMKTGITPSFQEEFFGN